MNQARKIEREIDEWNEREIMPLIRRAKTFRLSFPTIEDDMVAYFKEQKEKEFSEFLKFISERKSAEPR